MSVAQESLKALESDQVQKRETEQWQKANSQKLKNPTGWLALTGHYWLREGINRVDSTELAVIKLPNAAEKIQAEFTVQAASVDFRPLSTHRFKSNDELITKTIRLSIDLTAKEADAEQLIQVEDRYFLQLVRRSGRLAVRVRDPQAESVRHFPGKTWFPVDPNLRSNAQFRRWEKIDETQSTNIRGEAIRLDTVGEVLFSWKGTEYSLLAQLEGEELFLIFKDQTNGVETYGPGRFLNIPLPKAIPGETVPIVLDWNRAYNPPCAVSSHTLCPLAPARNRLPFSVRAGETYLPREKRISLMEKVMGPQPDENRRVPLDIKEISRETLDGYDRIKLTFATEKDDRVPAWLLIPQDTKGKRPAMLCLHQTIDIGKDEPVGLGDQESKRQALHLVKRGYICLAPDYPSFGEYPYDFESAFSRGEYQSGVMKAIWNNKRAVDLLSSLPEVDAERIGAVGHSLGGHTALFVAAFDNRVRAVVTSCGFCNFKRYYGGKLKGWTSSRYMPRINSMFDNDPGKVPFDFDDVLMSIFPRAIYVMAPLHDSNFDVLGVREVIEKVAPAYEQADFMDRLQVAYPNAGHEWPDAERQAAYRFLDKHLKH